MFILIRPNLFETVTSLRSQQPSGPYAPTVVRFPQAFSVNAKCIHSPNSSNKASHNRKQEPHNPALPAPKEAGGSSRTRRLGKSRTLVLDRKLFVSLDSSLKLVVVGVWDSDRHA